MVLLTAAGCADEDRARVLEPEDSVELEDPAAAPLARPVHLAVDSAGRIHVTNGRDPRVLVFDPDGTLLRVVGTEGSGPGELESVRAAAPLPGDRLAVAGVGERPGLFVYSLGTGQLQQTIWLDRAPSSGVSTHSVLLLGTIDYARGTSVLRPDLASDNRSAFGPVPDEYVPGAPRGGIFHRSFPIPLNGDSTLVAFEALGDVFLIGPADEAAKRLALPAPHRRGIPEDFDDQLEKALDRSYGEVFAQGSSLVHGAPAGDGRAALVHHDFGTGLPPLPEAAWLSVVDAREGRICADVPIPLGPDSPPVYAWHRGRFAVLQQELDQERGEAPPVVRWYDVKLERCRWREME